MYFYAWWPDGISPRLSGMPPLLAPAIANQLQFGTIACSGEGDHVWWDGLVGEAAQRGGRFRVFCFDPVFPAWRHAAAIPTIASSRLEMALYAMPGALQLWLDAVVAKLLNAGGGSLLSTPHRVILSGYRALSPDQRALLSYLAIGRLLVCAQQPHRVFVVPTRLAAPLSSSKPVYPERAAKDSRSSGGSSVAVSAAGGWDSHAIALARWLHITERLANLGFIVAPEGHTSLASAPLATVLQGSHTYLLASAEPAVGLSPAFMCFVVELTRLVFYGDLGQGIPLAGLHLMVLSLAGYGRCVSAGLTASGGGTSSESSVWSTVGAGWMPSAATPASATSTAIAAAPAKGATAILQSLRPFSLAIVPSVPYPHRLAYEMCVAAADWAAAALRFQGPPPAVPASAMAAYPGGFDDKRAHLTARIEDGLRIIRALFQFGGEGEEGVGWRRTPLQYSAAGEYLVSSVSSGGSRGGATAAARANAVGRGASSVDDRARGGGYGGNFHPTRGWATAALSSPGSSGGGGVNAAQLPCPDCKRSFPPGAVSSTALEEVLQSEPSSPADGVAPCLSLPPLSATMHTTTLAAVADTRSSGVKRQFSGGVGTLAGRREGPSSTTSGSSSSGNSDRFPRVDAPPSPAVLMARAIVRDVEAVASSVASAAAASASTSTASLARDDAGIGASSSDARESTATPPPPPACPRCARALERGRNLTASLSRGTDGVVRPAPVCPPSGVASLAMGDASTHVLPYVAALMVACHKTLLKLRELQEAGKRERERATHFSTIYPACRVAVDEALLQRGHGRGRRQRRGRLYLAGAGGGVPPLPSLQAVAAILRSLR